MSDITVSTICIASLLFFLLILFARNTRVRSSRKRPAARIERVQRGTRVRGPAHAITLVYSRSRLVLRPPSGTSGALFQR